MSALLDAKRHFWLGLASLEEPAQLLQNLVDEVEKHGFGGALTARNLQLENRVSALEHELLLAKSTYTDQLKRLQRKYQAQVEVLEAQLTGDFLYKRVQALESQLREARAQTQTFRQLAVEKGNLTR